METTHAVVEALKSTLIGTMLELQVRIPNGLDEVRSILESLEEEEREAPSWSRTIH